MIPGNGPMGLVNRDRLYEQVASQIQEMIVSSAWPAGARIPNERELGDRFGVSRTVIREALKALAERGLVTIRPGRGVFVADPSTAVLREPMKLFFQRHNISHENLVEARRVLEVEIAGLAARRAPQEEVERMRAAIGEMDESLGDPERFIKADQAFHLALAEATQNKMFPMLVDSIAELLHESRRLIFRVGGAPNRGQFYHRQLLAAVERRDERAARRAMREHLGQVEMDICAAGGLPQRPSQVEVPVSPVGT